MNSIIEEKFVKTFIRKNMQDRFLYELTSKNKRSDALSKFAHRAEHYLNVQHIYLQSTKLNIDDAEKEIKKLTNDTKSCYIIEETLDGELIPLRNALEISFDNYACSIIVINDNLGFVKAEAENGAPVKYILQKD